MVDTRNFFETYNVAITYSELNNYLRLSGEEETNETALRKTCFSYPWVTITSLLYSRAGVKNPFLRKYGTHGKTRKNYEIPPYDDNTRFYYPPGCEEYLWARFIFFPSCKPSRFKLLTNGPTPPLPKSAGVFILGALSKTKKGKTIVEIAKKLKYTDNELLQIRINLFETYLKPLIPRFIRGPYEFSRESRYVLSDLARKSCILASDKEFQERYRWLMVRRIIG